ncbi:MAG: hypothetical protein CM1200mP2_08780 [Planctomycetaceae bacterium]|nr:MAG: hypothetical protein CM1200mP2_08780 [Planctomycetaceae bacterium]
MSYGHRRKPFGNQVRLSDDAGTTWSEPRGSRWMAPAATWDTPRRSNSTTATGHRLVRKMKGRRWPSQAGEVAIDGLALRGRIRTTSRDDQPGDRRKNRVRMGVIGLGWFGSNTARPWPPFRRSNWPPSARGPSRDWPRSPARLTCPPHTPTTPSCWPIPTSTPSASSPCGTSTPNPPWPHWQPASTSSWKNRWPPPPRTVGRSSQQRTPVTGPSWSDTLPLQSPLRRGEAGNRRGEDWADRLDVRSQEHPRGGHHRDTREDRPDHRRRVHDTDLMLWYSRPGSSRPTPSRSHGETKLTPTSVDHVPIRSGAMAYSRTSGACPTTHRSRSTNDWKSSGPRGPFTSRKPPQLLGR